MPYRKVPLVEGKIYHIFTKSIANFRVFNSESDFERMTKTLSYYTIENPSCKFSSFLDQERGKIKVSLFPFVDYKKLIKILAYCIMPTHIHLVLKQLKDNGISRFVNLVLKSYTKYFNTKYNRKGPLWEGRFKSVLIETDEQFLHLTRYVHLNPVSSYLVDKPEDWKFSSYREYIGLVKDSDKICDFSEYLKIDIIFYKKFVDERIDYQRELEKIKHLILE